MWFPLNENISSSWPPKITFQTGGKSPCSSHTSPDAMKGIIGHPQNTRSGNTRSASRAIPNRAGRSNSLSVPTTPTSLWRLVPVPKAQDVMLARGLVGSEKCPHAPPGSRRIRPSPCVNVEPDAGLSKHDRAAPSDAPCPPPILPLTLPICPSPVSIGSVSPQWGQNERAFLRLWSAEKRNNPHLPLVFSPFNPLRALMPPLYWNSVNTTNEKFPKVEWNYKRPLPSTLRTNLRSRKWAGLGVVLHIPLIPF
jgi:hypothetical protein